MAGCRQADPAAARVGPGDDAPGRANVEEELALFAAVLEEIGPADPAVEPGTDLRRRLVRAART